MNSHFQNLITRQYKKKTMQKLLSIAHKIDRINQTFSKIARISVLLMLGLGVWNVIGRYLGSSIGYNLSSNGMIEGQWYLFDLIFLFGLSWTHQVNGHVRVDILQGYLSKKNQYRLELIGTIFLFLPFVLEYPILRQILVYNNPSLVALEQLFLPFGFWDILFLMSSGVTFPE